MADRKSARFGRSIATAEAFEANVLQSIDQGVRWWVDGLADILIRGLDRVSGGRRYRLRAADDHFVVVEAGGRAGRSLGIVSPAVAGAADAVLEPKSMAARLRGATVEIEVPDAWLFRRPLEPVAVKSVPYLDAFVRHQVERVTPWRAADTYFGAALAPIPGDAHRLAATLGAVPRHLLGGIVETVAALGPRRLSIATPGPDGFTIPLASEDKGRTVAARRVAGAVLAVLVLGTVGMIAAVSWYQTLAEAEIADVARLVDERKAFLRTAAERARPKDDPAEGLRAQRAATPTAVVLLEGLSAALPDQAHVTDLRIEKDQVRVAGIASDVSALIPALEASPLFRSVSFYAPTTRMQAGGGDRFNIEMRIEPQRAAEAR